MKTPKICGFFHGLNGDAVMSTVCCRVVKELYPNSELTFALSTPYRHILPLFHSHPYIDKYLIWEGNDSGLTENDYKKMKEYDIVFGPFPKHSHPSWYLYFHYINESLRMHGLPMTHDLQCHLTTWFGKKSEYKDYITISAFPSQSSQLNKTLSLTKWAELVSSINKLGYKCLQLGGKYDIQIEGAERPDLTFVQAAQALHSSRLQITTDTSWAWIGSAYKHNSVGLYGLNYPDMTHPFSHFPVNPNAKYLWRKNVDDIPLDEILYNIELKLK